MRGLAKLVTIAGALCLSEGAAAEETCASPKLEQKLEQLERDAEALRIMLTSLLDTQQRHIAELRQELSSCQGRASAPPAPSPSPAPTSLSPSPSPSASPSSTPSRNTGPTKADTPPPPPAPTGQIRGRVTIEGDAAPEDVYVYVTKIPAPLVNERARAEVEQKYLSFIPRFTVVQKGTRVFFPNRDDIPHHVGSSSPGNVFRVETASSGDPPGNHRFFTEGLVKLNCLIHAGMEAFVLVVPNSYYTKVAADGTFTLSGVPVGTRTLVFAGWNAAVGQKEVEVRAGELTTTAVVLKPRVVRPPY